LLEKGITDGKAVISVLTEAVDKRRVIDQPHFVRAGLGHPWNAESRDFQLASTIQEDISGTLPRLKW
jgi:hypothetical protein